MKHVVSLTLSLLSLWFATAASALEGTTWTVTTTDDQEIRVSENGTLFAEYVADCNGNPVLWPICSRGGLLMTRSFPMIDSISGQAPSPEMDNIYRNARATRYSEMDDHPHHRSLWFNHGAVNGLDFWSLQGGTRIEQTALEHVEATGEGVTIVTRNRWVQEKKNKSIPICTDRRTIVFGTTLCGDDLVRYIDYDITVFASEGDLVFGETKEGTLGLRVPGTMDVTAPKRKVPEGKTNIGWGGTILNSNGESNDDAWGKRANWVDYSGPVPARRSNEALAKSEQESSFPLVQAGITIMNHPESFRYPTWWHVRTYGLFAANPFGQKDFEPNNEHPEGEYSLSRGQSISFGYRILFHDGLRTATELDQAWSNYAHREGPEHPESGSDGAE